MRITSNQYDRLPACRVGRTGWKPIVLEYFIRRSPLDKKVSRAASLYCILACIVLCLSIGCNVSPQSTVDLLKKVKLPGKTVEDDRPKMGPTKVVADATALALELPESDLEAREKFRQRFSKLIAEDRIAAGDILVARRPDYAYEVLVNQFNRNDKDLIVLAASYDRFCGGTSGWHSLIRATSSETVDQYFFNRRQFLGSITNGHFDSINSIDLVSQAKLTGHESLLVDAYYQTGIAGLLTQQNQAAADAFAMAAQTAGERHGMQAATAQLMCSESLRRANDFAGATVAWQASVELAGQLIRTRSVTDTSYWERAAYLQPIGTPWPTSIATTLEALGNSSASAIRTQLLRQLASCDSGTISSACWIESAMGSWREARGASQKAIVHLKKAETMADGPSADWLRIAQAPILVSLGQNGVATTLLAPMIAREDNSPAVLAAMSKLGVMKLTGGSPQHGIRLLHKAVVDSGGVDWPGKSSARADLALGLLMIGENTEGITQLRQAQQHFEAEGEIEQLAKSLWNEQKYLEHSEAEKTEVAAVESRLKTMQL